MLPIVVGSRTSKLAIKQIEEVFWGLQFHRPDLSFLIRCAQTTGDLDQKTSLKDLGQTDFFTKELDEGLLNGDYRIAIHSAKDLPETLKEGLEIIAITQCKNNQDVLVLPLKKSLESLSQRAKIGASSHRREEGIHTLIPKAICKDIRGTIEKRLEYVEREELDGVVIAKVALQRLGITQFNMIDLPVETPPLQGSLAIVARSDDTEMKELFSHIDARRQLKSLYLGLDPSRYLTAGEITHLPLIQTETIWPENELELYDQIHRATHILLTSREGVKYFFEILERLQIEEPILHKKSLIVVGNATRDLLIERGFRVDYTPQNESQEGLIELFKERGFSNREHLLYPHSSKARKKLIDYLKAEKHSFYDVSIYNTVTCDKVKDEVNLGDFNEIVFTSPTTVKAFFEKFKAVPSDVRCLFKGPVTKNFFEAMHVTSASI